MSNHQLFRNGLLCILLLFTTCSVKGQEIKPSYTYRKSLTIGVNTFSIANYQNDQYFFKIGPAARMLTGVILAYKDGEKNQIRLSYDRVKKDYKGFGFPYTYDVGTMRPSYFGVHKLSVFRLGVEKDLTWRTNTPYVAIDGVFARGRSRGEQVWSQDGNTYPGESFNTKITRLGLAPALGFRLPIGFGLSLSYETNVNVYGYWEREIDDTLRQGVSIAWSPIRRLSIDYMF